MKNNPLLTNFNTPFESVPFNLIKLEHYIPAFEFSIQDANKNIEAIIANKEIPNFKNTIETLELAHFYLERTHSIYFNLYGIESDDNFKELVKTISPMLAKFNTETFTNSKLFNKIKTVFDSNEKLNLDNIEKRLLDKTYKEFKRNGALLSNLNKDKLKKLDIKLSQLGPKFMDNTLAAVNDFEYHTVDKNEVLGIPKQALESAKELAEKKGKKSGWIFTLQMPSYIPLITYCQNRELRKKLSGALGKKNLKGKFDNRDLILDIIKAREERAILLGYKTHSHYILEERMANSPDKVFDFLNSIYDIAHPIAKKELQKVKDFAFKIDGIEDFQNWDLIYYSEKLKKELFDFDEEQLRPYFLAENVIDGIFQVAKKMYGINFNEIKNASKYNEEISVYEVTSESSNSIGLLYVDLYPRETKQGGAWMNTIRTQGLQNGEIKTPQIIIAGNLTRSTKKSPSLLSFNEVNTLFHEFGHALHGLLSNVKYCSLASPNVLWDFVELPSQIMENWLTESETLQLFAKHYKSGKIISDKLVKKLLTTQKFNKGIFNNRQISLSLLDMAWHTTKAKEIKDVKEFEDEVNAKTRLLPKTDGCTSTSFGHIFPGGYSSGYYSYKWAELLEADAFEHFKERGIFNKQVCDSFRDNILSKGNSEQPMELYKIFRGRKPDAKAMLRRDGLI